MCSTDYDPPSMYETTLRKARKAHKCGECYRAIQPGETYQHVAGIWDGSFDTHKTCPHCVVGQKLLLDQCHGYLHEGIKEDLVEHLWPSIPWAMDAARLVVGMRRKWVRFDGKGLMAPPIIRYDDEKAKGAE